jgi:small-conductance mechanosensitive channel
MSAPEPESSTLPPDSAPTASQSEREAVELSNMEQAAQVRSDPEYIRRHAAKPEDGRSSFTKRDKGVLVLYVGIILVSLAAQWGITLAARGSEAPILEKLRSYNRGIAFVAVILLASKLVEVIALARVASPIARFNLRRVLRLVAWLAIAFVVISVLFVNWYTAVVSLGLISLLLSFSLQTPISSFVGWIYILARAPYRIGDRIRIGNVRGDVIDVSYLDTSLWEFGEYLSSDHPTGRVIKLPNSMVFSEPVINYSWPLFPYIWNEIKFHVAYDADLDFISRTLTEIATAELGDTMKETVSLYRDLLAKTPVDHLEVREQPSVFFRVSDNTWLEAIVRFLVPPKEAGRIKNRLTRKMLTALNQEPDRALFPKSNMR